MKIVLDTNVLVSGLLQALGPSGQIVRLVAAGELILCHDPRILAEYGDVLRREKFRFDLARVEALMEQIRAGGIPIARGGIQVLAPRPFIELYRTVLDSRKGD